MTAPKLRFKEFDGDWKLHQVGKFLIEYKEKVPSSTDIEIYSSSRDGLKPQKEYFDNRELQNFGEYGVVPPNYFTYRHMSDDTTFKFNINLVGKKIAVSKEYPVFTTNELMDSSFLLLKLNESNDFKRFAIEQKKGGTRTRLYFKALCNWETLLPVKEEQTQIASFLSAVDEKISQLTQKHQLLSQYKQGMMQKLFSQQLRFKADDGSEFGEWVEKKIIDVTDYVDYRGKTPKKVENGVLLVTAKNIRFGYIDYEVSQEYICSEDFDKVMRRGRAEIGDVLITTEAPLGNVASVDREGIALAQRVIKYRGKNRILNNEFLKQKFLSEDFQALISSKATGGTVQGIKGSTLHNLEIHIPHDIEEQTKIANFLSSIDQKIEVVAQQIEQAKTWKKGLLQQMFV